MDRKNINGVTLAVTAFNESKRGVDFAWIRECIAPAIEHPLVEQIIVVNDGLSDIVELRAAIGGLPKVTVFHRAENYGVFGNKLSSVELSSTDWVVMADSDNIMGADYYDRLAEIAVDGVSQSQRGQPWDPMKIYGASFAKPVFDYRSYVGSWSLADIPKLAEQGTKQRTINERRLWWCLANTGNWFVNRRAFLRAFEGIPRSRCDMWQPNYFGLDDGQRRDILWRHVYDAQDSFFINKMWWLAGGTLEVVAGLEYQHRVDKGTPGNYDRSPKQKAALAPVYYLELLEAARNGGNGDGSGKPVATEYRSSRSAGDLYLYLDAKRPTKIVAVNLDVAVPVQEFSVAEKGK